MSQIGQPQGGGSLPPDRRALSSPDDPAGSGEPLDEYLEIDPIEGEIENEIAPDGSLIVHIGDAVEQAPVEDGDFYANLAEVIPDAVMDGIVTDLLRKIEQDKESRKRRVDQYEEGIKRTGLGKDAPGGAQFEGASRAVHPGMTEACIDYQSRIMKELWPIAGPAKAKINGIVTTEKTERAKRKVEYMNWQLTQLMKEARVETEKTLSQVPLGGSQFIKLFQDHRLKRPRMEFVSIDKIALPATASSYHSASRRTFMDTVTGVEVQQRMDSGMYREIDLGTSSMSPDPSKAKQAQAKVEGVDAEPSINVDDEREIYETMTLVEVTDDMADILSHETPGELYPYLITFDVQTKKVLGLYRDWEQDDEAREPIEHLFEFPFITWDGAYAIGLPHIIGGLSGAATGALRALLDSAHIANTQGGLILKGSGAGGQTRTAQFGEFTEIDSGLETDDIRKKIMQFNTKEPSSVLFQLLGFLVEAQQEAVRTSMDQSAIDTNANTPVGTQLSRVEEGLVVFSAIHGRAHAAFDRLLAGLHRLNRLYLPEVIRVDAAGKEIMVRRRDFEGPPDVQPVSDPTIYSDQQRMAQINAIQQRATMVPQIYDARKVEERFLALMKVPDFEELLIKANVPTEMNAINENLAMALGRPVVAFPEQEHLAHLQAHLDFANSPVLGGNPIIQGKFLPGFIQHCAEHMLYHYVKTTTDLIQHAAGMDAVDLMSADPMVKDAFDRLLAMASQHVVPSMTQDFQGTMPVLMQALQKLQAAAPKPPLDPSAVAAQAAQAETARKAQNDQAQGALNQQKNAILAQRNQIQDQGNQMRDQTDIQRTLLETSSARDIASMRLASGAHPNFSDGASLAG